VLPLIEQYGWSDALRLAFEPHARAGHLPGRIIVQQREACLVAEHCWDPVGLAIVDYACRFERLKGAVPGSR
jgi:hypothetical protein